MGTRSNDVRTRLIESAITIFSKKWYSSASIAEICRAAGVSNGIYYHYFENKEDIFNIILELTINKLTQSLKQIKGEDVLSKIRNMVLIIYEFANQNKELVTIFREGQYRFIEYERNIVKIYKKTLETKLERKVTLAMYIYVFGGIRFACLRSIFKDANIFAEFFSNSIIDGIFKVYDINPNLIFNISIQFPNLRYPIDSRTKLLQAGKSLFGEKGYHEVNVHNIAEKAGFASGTFYKYFSSKESFFDELISSVSKEIRHFISLNLKTDLNRLEKEIQGIFLFLTFISMDRCCYNIVREAEFVNPAKVNEYYQSFVTGYKKSGKEGFKENLIDEDPVKFSMAIEFLIGISHFCGIEYIFDEEILSTPEILIELSNLLKFGLNSKIKKRK